MSILSDLSSLFIWTVLCVIFIMSNSVGLMQFTCHIPAAFPNIRYFLLNSICCDLFFFHIAVAC